MKCPDCQTELPEGSICFLSVSLLKINSQMGIVCKPYNDCYAKRSLIAAKSARHNR